MRAPKVVDFYTAAWPDFTPALTRLFARREEELDLRRGQSRRDAFHTQVLPPPALHRPPHPYRRESVG